MIKKKCIFLGFLLALILSQPALTQPQPFSEVKVQLGSISTKILTTGTVEPQNRLEIKPPIAGRVEEVLVEEGHKVKKGQLLAWMSSTERAALLDAARAISENELKKWQEYYKPTPIYAPIDGTVILRDVEPGQTFSSEAVFVLSDRLAVKAQVDETDLASISLQQQAEISLDAYHDKKIRGYVSHIAYEATTVNNVTTYIVDVIPETTPDFMRSGMTANITFHIETKNDILILPQNAIKYQHGRSYVQVWNAKHQPEQLEVKVGESEGENIEIKSGVKLGDTVLVTETLTFNSDDDKGSPFMPKFKHKK